MSNQFGKNQRRIVNLTELTNFKVFNKIEGEGEVSYRELLSKLLQYFEDNSIGGGSGVFDPDLPDELEASFFVGGIPVQTTIGELRGKSFEDLWVMALFSAIAAEYTNPTLVLSGSNPKLFEVGTEHILTLTSNFTQNDAGVLDAYRLFKDAVELAIVNPYMDTVILNSPDTIDYNSEVDYLDGPILNDSNGNPSPVGQILAGTVGSNIVSFQWIYPWFWGKTNDPLNIDLSDPAFITDEANKVVAVVGSSISFNPNSLSSEYFWFAVPASTPEFTEWFVTALNQGAIGGPGNLFGTPTVQVTNTVNWLGVNYDLYVTNFSSELNETIIIS